MAFSITRAGLVNVSHQTLLPDLKSREMDVLGHGVAFGESSRT